VVFRGLGHTAFGRVLVINWPPTLVDAALSVLFRDVVLSILMSDELRDDKFNVTSAEDFDLKSPVSGFSNFVSGRAHAFEYAPRIIQFPLLPGRILMAL
jgi:hypothetical protein